MPLSARELRAAATATMRTKSLSEARAAGYQTAFLSHSHVDRELAKGLARRLEEAGWRVYVDWEDSTMPSSPNRETAAKIKTKIIEHYWFLFLATQNSMTSRWCPWEIGYADGKKPIDRIIIIPTRDDAGSTHGNEYLQLYRRLDVSDRGALAVWQPGMMHDGEFVENLR